MSDKTELLEELFAVTADEMWQESQTEIRNVGREFSELYLR